MLDQYELNPLTPEKVESAQSELKVKLPDSYLELLKEKNGGSLYLNAFPISFEDEDYLVVDYLLGMEKIKGKVYINPVILLRNGDYQNALSYYAEMGIHGLRLIIERLMKTRRLYI